MAQQQPFPAAKVGDAMRQIYEFLLSIGELVADDEPRRTSIDLREFYQALYNSGQIAAALWVLLHRTDDESGYRELMAHLSPEEESEQ